MSFSGADLMAHYKSLRSLAIRLTNNASAAEDLVQDTYIRALRSSDDFQGGNLLPWLYTILRRLYINSVRNSNRQAAHMPLCQMPDNFEVWESFSAVPASQEDALYQRDLERACSTLKPEHLAIYRSVVYERLKYEEAAERFNLPTGTIKRVVSHARAAIMEFMNHGDHPGKASRTGHRGSAPNRVAVLGCD